MSETTPHRPRHALVDESGEPAEPTPVDESDARTTVLPTGDALFAAAGPPSSGATEGSGRRGGGEYTDAATVLLPIIPSQRAGSTVGAAVPASGPLATVPPFPTGPGDAGPPGPPVPPPNAPAGPDPVAAVSRRGRIRPAVLAAATAVVLVAGVAVGVSVGGGATELSAPPAPTATP